MPNKTDLAAFNQLSPNELELNGLVNLANAPRLADQLAQLITSTSSKEISLNLSQAAGGSALVALLLAGLKTAKASGVKLSFAQPTTSLSKTLQLSNLSFLLN